MSCCRALSFVFKISTFLSSVVVTSSSMSDSSGNSDTRATSAGAITAVGAISGNLDVIIESIMISLNTGYQIVRAINILQSYISPDTNKRNMF